MWGKTRNTENYVNGLKLKIPAAQRDLVSFYMKQEVSTQVD